MAIITLSQDEDFTPVIAGEHLIFGTPDGQETIRVSLGAGTRIVLDASFNAGGDRVVVSGVGAGLTVRRSGSSAIFEMPNGGMLVVPIGEEATTIEIAGVAYALEIEDGVIVFGGTMLGNDPLPVGFPNEAPVIDAARAVSLVEGATAVTASGGAVDPDRDPITYAIAGGADAARFVIDAATGALAFAAAPDRETPADANRDNVYEVVVRASDGRASAAQTVRVTVTDANDNAPILTAPAAVTVDENGRAVASVAASDTDGDALRFSIAGGADAARFVIDAATGALSFVAAPDFEAPGDADRNNVYDVVVAASDGRFTTTQAIAVTVRNVDDVAPVFTSPNRATVAENSVAPILTVRATDADSTSVRYAIAGGADAARFVIDAATGVLRFVQAVDFEQPADVGRDNVYEVVVRASDGTNNADQAIRVSVTDVDETVTPPPPAAATPSSAAEQRSGHHLIGERRGRREWRGGPDRHRDRCRWRPPDLCHCRRRGFGPVHDRRRDRRAALRRRA